MRSGAWLSGGPVRPRFAGSDQVPCPASRRSADRSRRPLPTPPEGRYGGASHDGESQEAEIDRVELTGRDLSLEAVRRIAAGGETRVALAAGAAARVRTCRAVIASTG
jgi:hypothetical protein